VAGGIEIMDEVEYAMPLGWFGRLANSLHVKSELEAVFDYRSIVLREYFGTIQPELVNEGERRAFTSASVRFPSPTLPSRPM
jgi:hypothetical protein